jgi:hypothetical protein
MLLTGRGYFRAGSINSCYVINDFICAGAAVFHAVQVPVFTGAPSLILQ